MTIRYWSNDSHWTFGPQTYPNWSKFYHSRVAFATLSFELDGSKPGDNVNIRVPRCVRLIVDFPLPRIRSLLIEGEVVFQQVNLFAIVTGEQ